MKYVLKIKDLNTGKILEESSDERQIEMMYMTKRRGYPRLDKAEAEDPQLFGQAIISHWNSLHPDQQRALMSATRVEEVIPEVVNEEIYFKFTKVIGEILGDLYGAFDDEDETFQEQMTILRTAYDKIKIGSTRDDVDSFISVKYDVINALNGVVDGYVGREEFYDEIGWPL